MSLYDQASLVLIPSGYKTSKLYCAKPTDGSGDLTFTRTGSTATRVNSAGLIEECRTNLMLYSQDFTNAAYVTGGYGNLATITANSIANPIDGVQNASTASFTAAGTQGRLLQTKTGLPFGVPYTYSLYIKAGTKTSVTINTEAASIGQEVTFNLSNGTITSSLNATGQIVALSNGWYRCSVTATIVASGNAQLGIITDVGEDGTLYIYGAQYEVGDIATNYILTTSAAVTVGPVANLPRLDYTGGGCPKLLMEPTRTNVQLYSEAFDNSAWTKTGSTVSGNVIVSPDGYTNADKLNETSTNDYHQIGATRTVSAVAHTMSVFAKKGERNFVRLYEDSTNAGAYFNLNTGAIGTITGGASAKIENYGNGWYRCIVTYTETGTTGRYRIALASADNIATYQGTAGNGIYIYGAQLEAGSYATSYIPTWNASVTRNADECAKTGISSLLGQTEGTWIFDYNYTFLDQVIQVLSFIGINNNDISLAYISGGLRFLAVANSVVQINQTYAGFNSTGRYKVGVGYKQNDCVLYINGVQVASFNNCQFNVTDSLSFPTVSLNNSGFYPKLNINQTMLFKTRLSNTDLATLTTL